MIKPFFMDRDKQKTNSFSRITGSWCGLTKNFRLKGRSPGSHGRSPGAVPIMGRYLLCRWNLGRFKFSEGESYARSQYVRGKAGPSPCFGEDSREVPSDRRPKRTGNGLRET